MDDLGGKWGKKSPDEPQHAGSSLLFTGWNFAMRWSRIDRGGERDQELAWGTIAILILATPFP